ncbi:uncharacterized protein LOC132053041 [Lycium ferocissimum]|uniref:uncharacterized protein LOC132053041 n=1 Tax=Lycium ferocissimum TaxID=112874 RepID=UPI002814CCF5|nr:uncharacterized protein LOC132053041 [Lycium ferocissimum]
MYSTHVTSFISIPFPPSKSKTNSHPKTLHPKLCNSTPKMSLNQTPNNTKLINTITKLLWGPSLPPQLLISTVRSTWSATWQLMMSQLAPSDPTGSYTRPTSQFRLNNLNSNPKLKKLHLYVGLPCPWAHRTLIVRALKGLEDSIPVSIASPGIDGSWEFRVLPDPGKDKIVPCLDKANGCKTLKEVYNLRSGGYSGRSTVPMLWDVEKKDVFCNESYDIIEFFNSGLNGIAGNSELNLAPTALKDEIRKWNDIIYPNVNNGVYRCGFAQSQEAYDKAAEGLFRTLEMLEDHLGGSRYLCGDVLTLADVCLFTTLIRFDVVYNVLFKCTKKKLIEFPNLHGYLRDIYQIPKVAETCNMGQIMEGYYKILFPLNPGGINPIMPSGCEDEVLSKPHNRDSLSLEANVVRYSVS